FRRSLSLRVIGDDLRRGIGAQSFTRRVGQFVDRCAPAVVVHEEAPIKCVVQEDRVAGSGNDFESVKQLESLGVIPGEEWIVNIGAKRDLETYTDQDYCQYSE